MTEQEFDAQIWRNYDRVTVQLRPEDAPWKAKVNSVCFPTHSVQLNLPNGGREWIRCEFLINHSTSGQATEDTETIARLHQQIMDAEDKLNAICAEKAELENRLKKGSLKALQGLVQQAVQALGVSHKKMERFEAAISRIMETCDNLNGSPMDYSQPIEDE